MTKATITKAVIPAAGLGTRFLPATIAEPKEMLPIIDKPVIQYVVEEAAMAGITDILIVTGRNKRAIEDHFDPPFELEWTLKEKNKFEILKAIKYISNLANVHFVRQKKQLGIADAVYQAKTFIGKEPFAVLLGDTLIKSYGKKNCLKEMIDLSLKTNKSVVAVEEVADELISRYGIVDVKKSRDGQLRACGLVEKPEIKDAPSNLAIACRYIFDYNVFDLIEKTKKGKGGEIQITDTMKFLTSKNNLLAYKIKGLMYDVGNKIDFIKTNIDFALERSDTRKEILDYIRQIIDKYNC